MAAEGALYIEGKLSPAIETKVPQWSQARYILEGSFILIGGSFHLTASLYETETTRLRKTFEVSGEKNHLSRAGEVLATQMAGFFSAEVKPLKDLPTDEDPETTLFFIRGLGFFIHGQFPRAYPEFMKILRQHPDHALARYWLARSFDQGGLKDQARIEYETFLRQYPRHPKAVEVSTALKEIR
jgi:TolA-binding protein